MGVTVQLMVDAEVSGVMFTCNPVSGDPSMVAINASWGLGLAVVGGEVTPDDYLVSKVTGEVVREHVHAKQIEYVPGAERPRRRARRGAARARERACLDQTALAKLVEVGAGRAALRLPPGHRVGDRPRRRQELFVVQSRPVTGLAKKPDKPPAGVGDGAGDEHVRRRPARRALTAMALSDEDVREILRIIDESELDELRIETEGFSLHVRKGRAAPSAGPPRAPGRAARGRRPRPAGEPSPPAGTDSATSDGAAHDRGADARHVLPRRGAGRAAVRRGRQRVEPDTIVCIIEVMKMMNSVPAGVSGTIVEVCAENARAGRVRAAAVPGAARHEAMKRVFIANRGEIAVRIVSRLPRARARERRRHLRGRPRRAGGAARRPRRVHRPGARGRELPARRHGRAGGARDRLRRDPSGLRLPVGEPAARGAARASTGSCSSGRRPR